MWRVFGLLEMGTVSNLTKKILAVGESSYLNTGFSVMAHEWLRRLHATGKYDILELGTWGETTDPRIADVPWKFIPVCPDRQNPEEVRAYDSNHVNQFGAWKFEPACLHFHPDIVFSFRDVWMDSFIAASPLRPHFYWMFQPTVDAEPQNEEWLDVISKADAVYTYTDWSLRLLNKQGGGKIKTVCSIPPGIDMEAVPPLGQKAGLRQRYGIDPSSIIVGTVMRDQARKLYPDLFEAFALYLSRAPKELASRTLLYCHTAWPEIGWDIPLLLKESGIASRVLFTYSCRNCGVMFPSRFSDAVRPCPNCGQNTAVLPTTHTGVSRGALNSVMAQFDAYVQYAVAEGFGIPMVEAAACGVPVFAVDYSAMEDVVRKVHGYPIKVQRFFRDPPTHRKFALPDNEDLVSQLIEFLSLPETIRLKKGWEARKAVEEHYTWDKTAKQWEQQFDGVPAANWRSPPRYHQPNMNIPQGLSNDDFVRWCINYVAGRPELDGSPMALRFCRSLNWGYAISQGPGSTLFNEMSVLGSQPSMKPFSRDDVVRECVALCENKNRWEAARVAR